MDIDRIRYFHVFAETGSLVKASEILHISQPALSKALRLLEHEVGSQLLEADGRGLKLTRAGLALRKETQGLLTQWLQVANKIKQSEASSPTKIGTFEVFSTHFLRILTTFAEVSDLELHEYGPGKLEEAVVEGIVDIGITYMPIPKAGIDFIEVAKVRMGAYGVKRYTEHAFSELPFVVPLSPVRGAPSKIVGLDGWPDHKFARKINYRVTMMESALELCRQGRCIAYLPNFIVEIHNQTVLAKFQLHELDIPVNAKDREQSVFLIQRSSTTESKLFRQIAKSVRTLR
jgi:DNA-binding transcriptional LysR family regulator